MLSEVTVNQIHKHFKKILDLSELSPNVNSLDIDKKNLAENLTEKKLVLFSAIIELDRNPGTDLQPRRIELDRNIGTDPYQIPERILGDDYQNPITDDTEETGKFDVEMPYVQSRIHSDYDSAQSIADSDLEDGELRKMLASPVYIQNRQDRKSSRMPIAPEEPAAMTQERGASAKRTQADLRESLMSSSSQEPRASVKPAALFPSRSDELGNQFQSSMFKYADPSKVGRSLLERNKGHLLSQARSELMRQEHQVGSLNSCINELQQEAYAQGLELQDAHHGYVESRREQARLQEDSSM